MDNESMLVASDSMKGVEDTAWETMIVQLTKALVELGMSDEPSPSLHGGLWSDGTNYENDTFLLHRFCWCEDDDCPYCGGCQCTEDAFWYEVDGKPVSADEWYAFFLRNTPDRATVSFEEWEREAKAANARRRSGQIEEKMCDYCRGTKFSKYGQLKDWGVPFFWHKPSGIRMSWYKHIGREHSVYVPEGCTLTANELLADCLNSLR